MKLLPCPFCGGEPEEDGGMFFEFYGHERQDYSIACKKCRAEVRCDVGEHEGADAPCSCHHDTRKICAEKWNRRATMLQGAEPVTTACKLPMQPLVIDAHGTLRFKENPIVRTLLDYATEHGYGLNEIAREEFDAEDQMHLAQLIGYSLSGYGTLSYVTDESYERAAAAAPQQEVK